MAMSEYPENTPDNEEPKKRSFESFTEAIDAGKAEAQEKMPDLKAGIANAMHDLAYGIGYGSVFAGSFVNELMPANMREGFAKGANAGKAAGKAASENVSESLDPSGGAEIPGDSPNSSFS